MTRTPTARRRIGHWGARGLAIALAGAALAVPDAASADTFYGNDRPNRIGGTPRADHIYGNGGAGKDTLWGGRRSDWLYGNGGNDRMLGGLRADWMYGNAGADTMRGEGAADHIYPNAGTDVVYAGDGSDDIWVSGDRKRDVVTCGPGFDQVHKRARDVARDDCEAVVGPG